jgi:hypothetical protein
MKKIYIFIFLMLSNIAMADCTYNGKKYSEGTVLGPYVCSGGQWITL